MEANFVTFGWKKPVTFMRKQGLLALYGDNVRQFYVVVTSVTFRWIRLLLLFWE